MKQPPLSLSEGLGIKQLIQDPKEFKKNRLNELTNSLLLSEQDNLVQQDILRGMENQEDKMMEQLKICEKDIAELEKDLSREARERKKIVEAKKNDWIKKLTEQREEMKLTHDKIDNIEENIFKLNLYLKHLKE